MDSFPAVGSAGLDTFGAVLAIGAWKSIDLAEVELLLLGIKACSGLIWCVCRVGAILHLAFPRYRIP